MIALIRGLPDTGALARAQAADTHNPAAPLRRAPKRKSSTSELQRFFGRATVGYTPASEG
jgi:hypothetical protein